MGRGQSGAAEPSGKFRSRGGWTICSCSRSWSWSPRLQYTCSYCVKVWTGEKATGQKAQLNKYIYFFYFSRIWPRSCTLLKTRKTAKRMITKQATPTQRRTGTERDIWGRRRTRLTPEPRAALLIEADWNGLYCTGSKRRDYRRRYTPRRTRSWTLAPADTWEEGHSSGGRLQACSIGTRPWRTVQNRR